MGPMRAWKARVPGSWDNLYMDFLPSPRTVTILDDARKNQSPEVEAVAAAEGVDPERLRRSVAAGRVVIPRNAVGRARPLGVGEGLRIKVNANVGSSKSRASLEEEVRKAQAAVRYGAHTVMDLSTGGDIDAIRHAIVSALDVPIGTVPIYQAGVQAARESSIVEMSGDDMLAGIEAHARDGVDFVTVHCGITRESVGRLQRQGRVTGVVSRGGSFLVAWILHNDRENPLYSRFDELLELAHEHDLTLSLGDGLRPGSLADATDRAQMQELLILGELVERCWDAGVQVMVEGPGHLPLHEIEANVRIQKAVCKGAPFYVLGPLVTDIAPGYDHITGAIGGAIAAWAGADFLCYVTPTEHIGLPGEEDVRVGVIASLIAAHAADIALGRDADRDRRMSEARKALDWDRMFELSLDPERARTLRQACNPDNEEACSMCGDLCALRMVEEALEGRAPR
jgi:phosphomethylpyrimidine synthase